MVEKSSDGSRPSKLIQMLRELDTRTIIGILFLVFVMLVTIIGTLQESLFINTSQLFLSSFYLGALYLCLSLGLTLTYKIVGFANFAHAEYFLVGAYVGVSWTQVVPLEEVRRIDIYAVLILAFICAGIVALLSDLLVFEPLRKRNSSPETLMISSIGVGIIIRNVVSLFFGGDSQYFRWIQTDNIAVPSIRFGARNEYLSFRNYNLPQEFRLTIYVTMILVGSLIFMLQFSKVGKALRATADNPDLAESSGIDTSKMIRLVWIIGGGLAGVSGVLYAVSFPVIPFTGFLFLLPAFAVVVFGGVGSLKGSILASFFIAAAQTFSVTYLTGLEDVLLEFGIERGGLSSYQRVIPFLVIIVVLFVKPQGLYGEDEEESSQSMKYLIYGISIIFLYFLFITNNLFIFFLAILPTSISGIYYDSIPGFAIISLLVVALMTYLVYWISSNPDRLTSYFVQIANSSIFRGIASLLSSIGELVTSVRAQTSIFISLIQDRIRSFLGYLRSSTMDDRSDLKSLVTENIQKIPLLQSKSFFVMFMVLILDFVIFVDIILPDYSIIFSLDLFIYLALLGLLLIYFQGFATNDRNKILNVGALVITGVVLEAINSFHSSLSFGIRLVFIITTALTLLNTKLSLDKILVANLFIGLLIIPTGFVLYLNDEVIDGFFIIVQLIIVLLWIYQSSDINKKTSQMNNLRLIATFVNYFALITLFLATGRAVFFREVIIFTAFYGILAISLNMSTGIVGILNFGVIAQVAVGAVVVGIATVNGMSIFPAVVLAMVITAVFSALLAISTVRLRDDYFAIVSITIGEIFRQFLNTEPTLRAFPGLEEGETSTTPGILDVPQPFFDVVNRVIAGTVLEEFSYRLFLGFLGIGILIVTFFIGYLLFNSPWGRVLRSVREDDEVVANYGKNVLAHKVIIMTISGAVAGLGGAYMAWVFQSLFPNNFQPLTTFYVWTAFIIGGRGNNKGMIAGSMIFVLMLRTSRFIDEPSNPIFQSLNSFVRTINPQAPALSLSYVQLIAVGLILIMFLRFAPRGVLAEEPYDPDIGAVRLPDRGSQADSRQEIKGEEK